MPKGNNAIPHVHQRKHFQPGKSQQGNIKVFLAQPQRKIARRRLRLQKAKKVFPRPLKMLRPQVACPTVRYNMKKRLGRGFTVEELKGANLAPQYAATIGIRVDSRRKNLSEEGLNANIQRLKTYTSKLVLFPINHKKVQAGEGSEADQKACIQDVSRFATATVANPSCVRAAAEPMRKLTADEKTKNVHAFLRKNISAVRYLGARMKRAQNKADREKEKAGKK